MRNMRTVLEDLDIRYTMPVQPVLLPRGGQTAMRGGMGDNTWAPTRSTASRDDLGNAGSFHVRPMRPPGRGASRGDAGGDAGA